MQDDPAPDGSPEDLLARDREQMLIQQEKLKQGEFTLDDFRRQMATVATPGFMEKMIRLMPGVGEMREAMVHFDARAMKALFGIIDAMTPAERSNVRLIDSLRRQRIAVGAGCEPQEVGDLIKQYESMVKVMTSMASKSLRGQMNLMGEVELKEREWPFKPRRDDDEERPPDDPLLPMLA